jgi:replicative superfamily II helicase
LKIAGALTRRKKVVFLAPTHALVEQLTEDLQEMFPQEVIGSVVSSDFDLLFMEDAVLQDIEVMTPERCLAMLSFAPEAFQDVGLLVFDECHLLSAQSENIRRALDVMLCVLGFCHLNPEADLLFLSAMLRNGKEFSDWIAEITNRPGVPVDLVWKPSRQARGVIIYDQDEIRSAIASASDVQRQLDAKRLKPAKTIRAAASRELKARPQAIWGLQHNWLSENTAQCTIGPLLDEQILLAGTLRYGSIRPTPNSNQVAGKLAAAAANRGLKTIVFVNAKRDAVRVAEDVSVLVEGPVEFTEAEQLRWEALGVELGGHEHSLLPGPAAAVPHNSAMLRLERDLAERMFKRPDGAKVIVATPTLAQGLNLPAQLASWQATNGQTPLKADGKIWKRMRYSTRLRARGELATWPTVLSCSSRSR